MQICKMGGGRKHVVIHNLLHIFAAQNIRFSCQCRDYQEEHLFRERFGNERELTLKNIRMQWCILQSCYRYVQNMSINKFI